MVVNKTSSSSSPRRSKFKRSSKACTTCRQMKLKCDAVSRFPKPCSRCDKYGSLCEIDISFERERRRTIKKIGYPLVMAQDGSNSDGESYSQHPHRRHQNQNQHQLRQQQGSFLHNFNTNGNERKSSSSNNSRLSMTPQQLPTSSIWPNDISELIIPPTKIIPDQEILKNNDGSGEKLIVSGETVRLMFNNFYTYFFPHLPILTRDLLNPEYLLTNGSNDFKLLFWVICAVSSSSCCDNEMADSIANHTKQQIAISRETLFAATPFHTLARVLALLIICHWPLHHNSLQEDQSWVYCSRAIDTAMRIGLHRSSFTQEYTLYDDNLKQQIAVATFCWSFCFSTNQLLGCCSGLPCLTSLNFTIFSKMLTLANGHPKLTEYVKQVKILHALRQAVETLGNNPDTEFGVADPGCRRLLHRNIEVSFSQLMADMAPLSEMTELYCLCAKLQIHSFLLVPDTAISDQQGITIPIYLVCCRIVDVIQALSVSNPKSETWPAFVLRFEMFTAVTLFGLMISPLGSLIDVDVARNKISEVYRLLSKIASRPNDIGTRGMRLIDGLQYMHSHKMIATSNLFTVKTRLGASAFWSLLLVFKRFQLGVSNSNNFGSTSSSTIKDTDTNITDVTIDDDGDSNTDSVATFGLEGLEEWDLWRPFFEDSDPFYSMAVTAKSQPLEADLGRLN